MRKFLLVALFFATSSFAHPQEAPQFLTGKVESTTGSPVSYATVAFLDKNLNVVTYGVCNEEGFFIISAIPPGIYNAEISCVGYELQRETVTITDGQTNIEVFRLKEGIEIEEVTVKGWPMIRMEPDRIIYDVEQDTTARNSVTMQILEKLPFVTRDKVTGELEVMGGSNYVITINGKKSLFLSEANQYVTKIMEADKIKQIELQIAPQGRYNDKTAVLNIVTKGNLPDGIVGNISGDLNHEFIRSYLSVTSKINKFIYNVNYQPESRYYHNLRTRSETTNYQDDVLHLTQTDKTEWSKDDKHNIRFNSSYDLNSQSLITISGTYSYYRERVFTYRYTSIFNSQNTLMHTFDTDNRDILKNNSFEASANYQKSFGDKPDRLLTATYRVEYNTDKNRYMQNILNGVNYVDHFQRSTNNLDLAEHTLGVDFSNPVNKQHSYFITGKFVVRNYGSNSYIFENNNGGSSADEIEELSYKQYIYSLRANYTLRYKKIMLVPQVGWEVTDNRMRFGNLGVKVNKTFSNIIPQIIFICQLNDKSSIILNYSIPPFRPDIYYLNPFVNDSDPSHIIVGNPDLKSESSQLIYFSYNFFMPRFSMNLGATYKYSDNAVYPYDFIDENGIRTTTYGNIGRSNLLTFHADITYRNPKKLEIQLKTQARHSKYSYDNNSYPLWNFTADASITFYVWRKGFIQAMSWLTPLSTSLQSTKFNYYAGYSLRAGYHFNEKVSVVIDVERFLKKHLTGEEEKRTPTFYYRQWEEMYGRMVTLSFRYTFGRLNARVKQSHRTIINEDRDKSE